MSLSGANDQAKLNDLASRNYKFQAIWFLNSFWKTFGEQNSEKIWKLAHEMSKIDVEKKLDGNQLDEVMAHRFLEVIGETHTVRELRDKLYSVGVERAKYVALIHYLIFSFNVDWHYLVNAAQGDNQEEVAKAQRMLAEVQIAFQEVQKTAEASAAREKEAIAAERAAKEARAELERSLAELKAQEDAYHNKTEDLKRKTTEGGVVAQNKAKAELAQHLAEDPLPLRRAKINTEAAVKKAERAAKAAEEAVAAAKVARAAAEAALEVAGQKVEEAEAYLQEVKNKPGSAQGAVWWMERELHEARAYLPTAKGGYTKKKV